MKRSAFLEMLAWLRRLLTGAGRQATFRWSAAALRDLGLSPSDLPAIETGRYAVDATRRQR